MSPPLTSRASDIRAVLSKHTEMRLSQVLERLTGSASEIEKERKKQRERFHLPSLIESGAVCVTQIQMATHILKGIHPDPEVKKATNILVTPSDLAKVAYVGSHVLGDEFDVDATGNGAFNKKTYEIFLLLNAEFEGSSVLNLLKNRDPDAIAALGGSSEQSAKWAEAFARIDSPRCNKPASHTLAKQIYWLVADDPHDDASYHLLAPLYPTSLAHRVYQKLQDDRFGDEARAAREARKQGVFHERPVREYPNLAIQTLGGTKPQNISQLNSERRGDNCLLASFPPLWRSLEVKPLYGTASLFKRYGARLAVRNLVKQLRGFLVETTSSNVRTRQTRDEIVLALIDELVQFSAELRTLEPGWSAAPECELPEAQRAFLDPLGSGLTVDDAVDRVAADFANWLNAQLREPLPVGDPEFLHWRKLAREPLHDMQEEVAHEQ
ncbi:type I-F CRISPR-associated protein Csy1 [Rhodocyclus gracilis]|uniref:Type I-F CRISPR-associated protein Csy1 n=1 Tax=Rhodocyclus tenuis TaxID=1066 RepID=A0A6L5JYK3_RHOTE|nr:type I-F CRISPR-associated protein Csy1 [Rhodocyclus gracilis]MQY51288.1 type I-F CRISPR-associated protein Csy1 [Rhodocyclus gracilis]